MSVSKVINSYFILCALNCYSILIIRYIIKVQFKRFTIDCDLIYIINFFNQCKCMTLKETL